MTQSSDKSALVLRERTNPSVAPRRFGLALAATLQLALIQKSRAENQVDYRYGYYQEDDSRIEVQTHSALFDVTLKEGLLSLSGEVVHDAVSGATPYGAPPPSKLDYSFANDLGIPVAGDTNNTSVLLTHMEDERNAFSIEAPVTFGVHEVTPQFSFSEESDYTSYGGALNYSLQLNEKNTTLNVGWAHTSDRVRDTLQAIHDKRSDDFLAGINQLLGPKTVLGINFTYGEAHGYLNDPYRIMIGVADPQFDVSGNSPLSGGEELRPNHREKYIGRVSITQFITPVNASVEGAYRFYHDSFGIDAHTAELSWYQKIGKHVIVAPNARYNRQSAADFYYEALPGMPFFDPGNYPTPKYYSPDYRLSELQSFTAGINITVMATKWLTFDASYKRYIMEGLDGVTSQSAYPSANIFSVGARVLF